MTDLNSSREAAASPKTAVAPPVRKFSLGTIAREPLLGPLGALIVAVIVFSVITDTFLTPFNISLILQQTTVVGTLAIAQTLVILTNGIDLSIGSIAVLGTVVMAKVGGDHGALLGFAVAAIVCLAFGSINGVLVTALRLPPFIVTLGAFTAIYAVGQLYGGSTPASAPQGFLTFLGKSFNIGAFPVTYGIVAMLVAYGIVWYSLSQTAAGRHIYALGGNPDAARLVGIKINRTLFFVYFVAGVIAVLGAWAALGRTPEADPNAFQIANLETITAVVIGGTSLFGGRGSVIGTLIGALIVGVLRSGLSAAHVDALYQNVATGILVIAAVAIDQLMRRKSS